MKHWLESTLLQHAGFVHGFTMRAGGVSEGPFESWNFSASVGDSSASVEKNVALLAERISSKRETLHGVHQVHGDRIVEVTSPTQVTTEEEADGLLITAPATTALIKTADCVPVLVVEQRTGFVAALHAGWRGVHAGIVPAAVRRLSALVDRPACLVAIGPHIGPDAFQVGPDVANTFADHARPDPSAEGKYLVSLSDALREQLNRVGLRADQIDQVEGCTLTDPEHRFFSYRRSGGHCGRQVGFVRSR